MKAIALALTSVVFSFVPHQPETRNLSAAVTDTPLTVDMSYADPATWHALPLVHPAVPGELGVIKLSGRSRLF
jgi:hypothetical protein